MFSTVAFARKCLLKLDIGLASVLLEKIYFIYLHNSLGGLGALCKTQCMLALAGSWAMVLGMGDEASRDSEHLSERNQNL